MRFMFKPLAFNSIESTNDAVVCCGHYALLVPKKSWTEWFATILPALQARPLAALQAMCDEA